MVMRVAVEMEKYICELGNEARLISMQLDELLANVESHELLIIEDYMEENVQATSEEIQERLRRLSSDELMDITNICGILGFDSSLNSFDTAIFPRGYRLLSKIPRVPLNIIKNLVDRFLNFQGIINATIDELDEVEGIGEVRSRLIKEGLRRVQEQLFLRCKKNIGKAKYQFFKLYINSKGDIPLLFYLKLYFPSILILSSSFNIMSYKFKSKVLHIEAR